MPGSVTVWSADNARQICDCDKGPLKESAIDYLNAQLISAAPDLLAALIDLVESAAHNLEQTGYAHDQAMLTLAHIDAARAAIAQAEGRAL